MKNKKLMYFLVGVLISIIFLLYSSTDAINRPISLYNRFLKEASLPEQNPTPSNKTKLELAGTSWIWVKTELNNDTSSKPKKYGDYKLTFNKDSKFYSTTDCNNLLGNYRYSPLTKKLEFLDIASTFMYCEGIELQNSYGKDLEEVESVVFTNNGNIMNLQLKYDSGVMVFEKTTFNSDLLKYVDQSN